MVLSLSRCKRGRLALFASMGVRVGKSIPPFAIESNPQRRCLSSNSGLIGLNQTLECAQLGSLNCDLVVLRLQHHDHMKLGGLLVHSTEEGRSNSSQASDVANPRHQLTSLNLAQGSTPLEASSDSKSCLRKPMTVRVQNRRIIIDDKDSALEL